MKEEQERKKTLVKYIPTISKALFNVLQKIEVKLKRKSNSSINDDSNSSSSSSSSRRDSKKRGRDDEPYMNDGLNNESHSTNIWSNMMTDVSKKVITENSLSEYLQNGVDKFEIDAMLQSSIYQEGHGSINSGGGGDVKRQKVFIIPSTQLMSYGTVLDEIIRGDRSSSGSSSATSRPHDSSLSDVVHNSFSKTKVSSTHDDVIDLTDDTTVKTIHTTGKDVQKPAFKWVPFPITSTTHTIVGTNTAHFVGYVLISTEETL